MEEYRRKLAYIMPVVEMYTVPEGNIQEYDAIVRGLSPSEVEEIARLYDEMHRRQDGRTLSELVDSQGIPPPQEFALFHLFSALKRRGVRPFTEDLVTYTPACGGATGELPVHLGALAAAADRYGPILDQKSPEELWSSLTGEEIESLTALAARVRGEDCDEIHAWRDAHSGRPEERAVSNLLRFLNVAVPQFAADLRSLDWGSLPEEISYLKEGAVKYGVLWNDPLRDRFLDQINDQDLKELVLLNEKIGRAGDKKMVESWLGQHPPFVHGSYQAEPSTLVYFLLELLFVSFGSDIDR